MRGFSRPGEVVAIGGSSGSLAALQQILERLPPDYRAAVIVVTHQHRHGDALLAEVLAARCALPVETIRDGDPIVPGRVYVAPPNYHVLVERDHTFALSLDPPVNYARPSIDVLFESAARVYGARLIGILLSGASTDGAAGLAAIGARGGGVACQDPDSADEPTMPLAGCAATPAVLVAPPGILAARVAEVGP